MHNNSLTRDLPCLLKSHCNPFFQNGSQCSSEIRLCRCVDDENDIIDVNDVYEWASALSPAAKGMRRAHVNPFWQLFEPAVG